jgi:hypothetical protein
MKLALPSREHAARAAAIVLALVALAGVVTGREKPAHELVETRPARHESAATGEIDLAKLQRPWSAAAQGDPFAPRSFAPPAPAARAAAAEKPSAPPLPFAFAGRLTQNGVTEVLVTRGEEIISIAAGQNIDGEYRVDAISESRIAFTYLPLKEKQSLQVEEAGG